MPNPELDLIQANGKLAQLISRDPAMLSVEMGQAVANMRMLIDRMDAALNGDESSELTKLITLSRGFIESLDANAERTGQAVDFLLDIQAANADVIQTLRDQRDELLDERDTLADALRHAEERYDSAFEDGFEAGSEDDGLVDRYTLDQETSDAYDNGHEQGYEEGALDRALELEPPRENEEAWIIWHNSLSRDEQIAFRSTLKGQTRDEYDTWFAAQGATS